MTRTLNVTMGKNSVRIVADVIPYRPATMYEKNGDPGSPAEGGIGDVTVTVSTPLPTLNITDIIETVGGMDYIHELIEEDVANEADHLAALREDAEDERREQRVRTPESDIAEGRY